jgi:hypothetical protein
VRVNDVEPADVVFGLEHVVYERPAHVVYLIDKVGVQVEWATVIVHTIDPRVVGLAMSHASEYVDLVTLPFQRSGQFGDVHTDTADSNRVERLPGEHCYSHHTYRLVCGNQNSRKRRYDPICCNRDRKIFVCADK